MNDNYPPGCTESMLPGNSDEDRRYELWFQDRENELLKEFQDGLIEEYGPDAPEVAVKNWTKYIQKDFDDYVDRCWQDERESD